MTRLLAGWGLLSAIYLLFAGQFSATEAAAGVTASLLCAVIAQVLDRAGQRHFSPAAPWPRLLGSICRAVAIDPAHVAVAIARGCGGQAARQPFRHDGHDQAGRRALVTLASSLAPNGIVIAVEQDALLIHRLHARPPDPDRDWPL